MAQDTKRTHRILGRWVWTLLALNSMALVALLAGVGDESDERVSVAAEEESSPPREVTLVVAPDGTEYLADPTTPDGRQAIDNAVRDGATVRTVFVSPTPDTKTLSTPPGGTPVTAGSGGGGGNGGGGNDAIDLCVDGLPTLPVNLGSALPTGGVTQTLDSVCDAASLPAVPTTLPTIPTTLPTIPTTLPTIPTTVPTIPTTVPTIPTTVPTIPTTVPTIPTTVPTVPTLPSIPSVPGLP